MNITRAAIEKNRITAVALIFVFLAGINTFLTMPKSTLFIASQRQAYPL
jgi:hypothetical protein